MKLAELVEVKENHAAIIRVTDPETRDRYTLVYYNHQDNQWLITDWSGRCPNFWGIRMKNRKYIECGAYFLGKRINFRVELEHCELVRLFIPQEREMFLNHFIQ